MLWHVTDRQFFGFFRYNVFHYGRGCTIVPGLLSKPETCCSVALWWKHVLPVHTTRMARHQDWNPHVW